VCKLGEHDVCVVIGGCVIGKDGGYVEGYGLSEGTVGDVNMTYVIQHEELLRYSICYFLDCYYYVIINYTRSVYAIISASDYRVIILTSL
jgi:hypothetical protein